MSKIRDNEALEKCFPVIRGILLCSEIVLGKQRVVSPTYDSEKHRRLKEYSTPAREFKKSPTHTHTERDIDIPLLLINVKFISYSMKIFKLKQRKSSLGSCGNTVMELLRRV